MNKKTLQSQPMQWLILDRLKEILPDNRIDAHIRLSEDIRWNIIIYPHENMNKDVYYQLNDNGDFCLRIDLHGNVYEERKNMSIVEYLCENSGGEYKFKDEFDSVVFKSNEVLSVDNFADKVKSMVDYFDNLIAQFNTTSDWHKVTKDAQSVVYTNDGKVLIRCNDPEIEEYQIKEGTQVVWGDAFKGKEKLRKVVIPEGVTHIYAHAFDGCEALEFVIFPRSVQFIGYRAFGNTRVRKSDISRVARCDKEATEKYKNRPAK